jgi:hypothetical protein
MTLKWLKPDSHSPGPKEKEFTATLLIVEIEFGSKSTTELLCK